MFCLPVKMFGPVPTSEAWSSHTHTHTYLRLLGEGDEVLLVLLDAKDQVGNSIGFSQELGLRV